MFDIRKSKTDGLNAEKVIKNPGVYSILLLCILAMTVIGVCNPGGGGGIMGPRGTAATVEGEDISGKEFRRAYQQNYDQYSRQYGEAFDPAMLKIADMTMNQLIDARIRVVFAESIGVAVSDQEIIEDLREVPAFKDESGKFSKENFENWLRGYGYTEASLLDEQRRSMMMQRAERLMGELVYTSAEAAKLEYRLAQTKREYDFLKLDSKTVKPEVSDQEVTAFVADKGNAKKLEEEYAKRSNEFNRPEKLKARHILISFKGARNATGPAAERAKEEAKALAEAALARATAAGADFPALATEMTDEPSGKAKGGDLGEFSREDMVKEFSEAAFALQPGAVSGIVESPFGFHVIKVEDKIAASKVDLKAAQPVMAREILVKQKAPELLGKTAAELLAALKSGNNAESDALIQKYGLAWQSTGPVSLEARNIQGIGSSDAASQALAGLTPTKPLVEAPVAVNDARVIFRFVKEIPADMSKFAEAGSYQEMMSMTRGYFLYSDLQERFKDQVEEKGRIWRNEDYITFETQGQKNPSDG